MALIRRKPTDNKDTTTDRRCRSLRGPGGLLEQLSDPNPTARRWAVRDLADFPEAACPLLQRLREETDASVREVIFTTLMGIGGEEVVSGLIPFFKSEDAALRNGAVEVCHALPEVIGPHLEALLQDTNADVRIFAVDILREIAHPSLLLWLQAILELETHVNVCASAVDCLMEVGTSEQIPALRRLRERFPEEPFLAFVVDTAIRRIENVC